MTGQKPPPGAGDRQPRRSGVSGYATDLLTDMFVDPLDPGYADAAERRRTAAPASATRRRFGRAGTVVVLLTFGLLIAMAYQQVVAGAPAAARARAQLVDDVTASREESQDLERRAARLRDQVAAERDRALGGGSEADRLRDLEAQAGLAAVSGPGISVTLADSPVATDPVTGEPQGENLGRVLDRDLQRAANALWAAGAEAITIGGQRLSAVSTIRAAGQAIMVDFTPVTSPYVVNAIGPPSLRERFVTSRTAQAFRYLHDKYGMGFTVRERENLTLAAAPDPQLRHARPREASGSPSRTGGD